GISGNQYRLQCLVLFYVGDAVFLCTVQEGTSVTLTVFTHVSADLDDQRQPICDRVFVSRAVLFGTFER
ncbi:putative membrane protein, partial [Vibrio parahaemolyticus V-223/04]